MLLLRYGPLAFAVAELALGLVRLKRGALTESLVAEVAHVGALPSVGPEKKKFEVAGSLNKMIQKALLHMMNSLNKVSTCSNVHTSYGG